MDERDALRVRAQQQARAELLIAARNVTELHMLQARDALRELVDRGDKVDDLLRRVPSSYADADVQTSTRTDKVRSAVVRARSAIATLDAHFEARRGKATP